MRKNSPTVWWLITVATVANAVLSGYLARNGDLLRMFGAAFWTVYAGLAARTAYRKRAAKKRAAR